jgi:hypothetical protein
VLAARRRLAEIWPIPSKMVRSRCSNEEGFSVTIRRTGPDEASQATPAGKRALPLRWEAQEKIALYNHKMFYRWTHL